MKKFSEIAKNEPAYKDAEFVKSEALMGKTLAVKEFTEVEGSNGKYAIVLATADGKDVSFSIGGVVYDQLIKNKDDMPYEATLEQVKSTSGRIYYSLK